jgi:hypothetical protein
MICSPRAVHKKAPHKRLRPAGPMGLCALRPGSISGLAQSATQLICGRTTRLLPHAIASSAAVLAPSSHEIAQLCPPPSKVNSSAMTRSPSNYKRKHARPGKLCRSVIAKISPLLSHLSPYRSRTSPHCARRSHILEG